MTKIDDTLPAMSWREMEALLLAMATTDAKRRMVRHLTSGTRKQAVFLPAEAVMKELFLIASALLDIRFNPSILASWDSLDASSSSSASPPSPLGS